MCIWPFWAFWSLIHGVWRLYKVTSWLENVEMLSVMSCVERRRCFCGFSCFKFQNICHLCFDKVFAWGFRTDRATKELDLYQKKNNVPVYNIHRSKRLIRFLLYGFWFIFPPLFLVRCCRLPYMYLWACWFLLHVYTR